MALMVVILAAPFAAFAADGGDAQERGTLVEESVLQAHARKAVRREAEESQTFHAGTWRLRASWPLQLTGAAGVLVGRRPASWDCVTVCEFRGFHAQAEIGTGGAQIVAGWASLVGETDDSARWLSRVYVGYALRGALMRTGGYSNVTPADQTYAGIEATVAATQVSLSVAVYRRVSRGSSRDPWMVGAGLGWGF